MTTKVPASMLSGSGAPAMRATSAAITVPTGFTPSTAFTSYSAPTINEGADFDPATGKFTPQVAGLYQVNASISYGPDGLTAAFIRAEIRKNRGMDAILDLSTNKAIYAESGFKGSATGVKSSDFVTTGNGSAVTQFVAVQIPAVDAYPTVAVSVDEKNSAGAVKLRFTNLSDGTANTAGTFNIDWIAY